MYLHIVVRDLANQANSESIPDIMANACFFYSSGDDDDDDQLWRGPWGPTHTCFPFFPFMVKIFTVAGG